MNEITEDLHSKRFLLYGITVLYSEYHEDLLSNEEIAESEDLYKSLMDQIKRDFLKLEITDE